MKNYTETDDTSYTLGMSLTIEALLHRPDVVRKVILSSRAKDNRQFRYLLELCNKHHIETLTDDKTIGRLSVKENCYCIGMFDKYRSPVGENDHVLLYRFDDHGELGTVFRSCVSFDFHDIILIDPDVDHFDPRCIRASMGSFFQLNIVSYASLAEYEKDHPGRHVYAFCSDGRKGLDEIVPVRPAAFLLSQDYHHCVSGAADSYHIEHSGLDDISLSIRSSIILEHLYHLKRSR